MHHLTILTSPIDMDATIVAAAAALKGINCQIWYGNHFPEYNDHEFCVSQDTYSLEVSNKATGPLLIDDATIWLRDLCRPQINLSHVHQSDREYVKLMNEKHFDQFFQLLVLKSTSTFWINKINSAKLAESKMVQLVLAQECEFHIPETIFSNNPVTILNFYRRYDGNVIRKSVYPYEWEENGAIYCNKTTDFMLEKIDNHQSLKLHPEIYQVKIDKMHEVRTVFFGINHFSVIIDPKEDRDRVVDWRIFHSVAMGKVRKFVLSDKIVVQCIELMRRLDIVSGSFDFFLDKEGRYYFGEVNQGGQFLWMERCGLGVLNAFLDFCVSRSSEFVSSSSDFCTLDSVVESQIYSELEKERRIHQDRRTDGN
jgi:CMP-N-acetylneuraminic acid synthetase